MNINLVVAGLFLGIACYQVYVTVRVVGATEYSRVQKAVQVIMIWVVPFLGAGLCHLVLYTSTDRSRSSEGKSLEDNDLAPYGGRLEWRERRPPKGGSEVPDTSDADGD